MDKRTVLIYVANQRFNISSTDSEEYIIEVGEKVDMMIKGISKSNPRLNRDGCATLCALSLCDDLTKLQKRQEEIRLEMKSYLKDAKALREENEALKAQLEELKLKAEAVPQQKEKKEEKPANTPAESSQKPQAPTEAPKRQTAFVGKDFRNEKKKRHNHEEKRNQSKPWMQQKEEKKPVSQNTPPDADERGLPDEPPLQYSIFDTDFI